MARNLNYSKALEIVGSLSHIEKDALVREIIASLGVSEDTGSDLVKKTHCDSIVAEAAPSKPDCPHCGAKSSLGYIIKKGNHKGAQRYQCKSCGKKFVSTTNTVFSRTRKDAETWHRFIEMTVDQRSLAECAEECDICIQTAFTWRHKILNAFAVNQKNTMMTGNVEVDEMLIPISYKGNHVQGSFGERRIQPGVVNDIPRDAFKRGSDNVSRSSKEKACVFCMVEDGNKAFYAAVPGVGFMNDIMLEATVAKHVDKEKAMMLADDYKVTKKFFEKNGYQHTLLLSNTSDNPKDHKPEIRDGLHLQHVNAMHHHIRDFLRVHGGVSAKYLSNYISLYIWLKSVSSLKKRKAINKASVARTAVSDCYITYRALAERPAVPMCA